MVTVYVVEQHRAVRQALADWLAQADGIRLVGSSGDLETARREIEDLRAEVVLLEIKRADGKGLQLLSDLAALSHQPRILVLTSYPAEFERDAVIQAGADAHLLKDIDTIELEKRILSN